MAEFKVVQIWESARGDNTLLVRVAYGCMGFTVFWDKDKQRFQIPSAIFIERDKFETFCFIARRAVTDYILRDVESSSELKKGVENAHSGEVLS